MLIKILVSENDAGQRAERYLRKYFPHIKLDRLQSLFRRNEIKLEKKPIDTKKKLHPGDELFVYGIRPEDLEPEVLGSESKDQDGNPSIKKAKAQSGNFSLKNIKPDFEIPILFEDEEMLVLDKPGGLAVHPGTDIPPGQSLIEKVWVYLLPDRHPGELFQPSLVHRLDKETSGVIVVAKTGGCLRRLNAALREGHFHKRYLALVNGHIEPRHGEISTKLNRIDGRNAGAKTEVSEDEGKWSITQYKTIQEFAEFSLLSVVIETGRMHQIRAHLSHIGHAIAGDPRYGDFEKNRVHRKAFSLKRTFLHAADLNIELGSRGKLSFKSPLAKDLKAVVEKISQNSPLV